MFKEIARKNGTKFLLNTDDIAFISEKVQEPIRLYDELGNVVEEREPEEKTFEVVIILKNGHHKALVVNEDTYNELVKDLK